MSGEPPPGTGLPMQSGEAMQRCTICGAGLTLDHLRGTNCPFCKTVFPHHAQAVAGAALVQQVMAQQMAGQHAMQQQSLQQVFGGPPPFGLHAPPPMAPPPGFGAPPLGYGIAPPPYGASIGYDPTYAATSQAANRMGKTMMVMAIVGVAFALLGIGVAIVVAILVL